MGPLVPRHVGAEGDEAAEGEGVEGDEGTRQYLGLMMVNNNNIR